MASRALVLLVISSMLSTATMGQPQVCNLAAGEEGWTQESVRYQGTPSSTASSGRPFHNNIYNIIYLLNNLNYGSGKSKCCR